MKIFDYNENNLKDITSCYNTNGVVVIKSVFSLDLLDYLKRGVELIHTTDDLQPICHPMVGECKENYRHILTETLLSLLGDVHEKCVGRKLIPTYSYLRKYLKGNKMSNHTDRPSCQHSMTINLSSSDDYVDWPLYVKTLTGEEYELDVEPFDLVLYMGERVLHGRERCLKDWSVHTFLHWVDATNEDYKQYWYDGELGLYK